MPSPATRLIVVGTNVAETVLGPVTLSEQVFAEELSQPPQPVNVDRRSGVAVKVTKSPGGTIARQFAPQSIPPVLLVTVPEPLPILLTLTLAWTFLNVAVTSRPEPSVTVQLAPAELSHPLQPASVEPGSAVAVKVTDMRRVKTAEQAVPQSIPAGALVTRPSPPSGELRCTVRR